ncbi:hypothetical protein C8R41DRAFT_268185 [Lentinula lateritia]|uniref:Uncharacterized protein n=1 Tax=Lentinula lateritia TaxID=40482 RepID=A0ABQ8VM10_9AGAR|nr:hypothetical protein C8R41DRAFT_268185 [Lentinula lateritia]
MPPSHRSNSLQHHPEEASSPPISREVTTSPRWEQDSDRGGRLTHDRSLEPSNPLTEYPSRNAPANHERDQGQPEPHRSVNGYHPSSLPSTVLPYSLPPKPVLPFVPDHNRTHRLRASPQRDWRPVSTENRPRRGPSPQRHWEPPKRPESPVDSRRQRRDLSPQHWSPPRQLVSPIEFRGPRRAPSPQRDRTPPKLTGSPEARGPRRRLADVQFPPPHRNEARYSSEYSPKTLDNRRRAPDIREPADMDVDDVPPRQHNDQGKRDQTGNHHERPPVSRRGGSLLDRLSISVGDQVPPLRERVQIPAKRDREELMRDGGSFNGDIDMDDGVVGKKPRRRSGKPRRGRGGRGAGAHP